MSEVRIIAWLRNQIGVERSGGPVIRFELKHLAQNSKIGQEVLGIDAQGEAPPDDWFESVAAQIMITAESDAQAIGGCQTYAIFSFRQSKPEKVSSRCVFRVDGGSDIDEDIGAINSEPATKDGLLKQLMRHNEVSQKTLSASFNTMMTSCQRVISRLTEQNEALQNQRMETVTLVEELLSKKLDRDLEIEREREKQRMIAEGMDTVKMLAPAIVNRLASKNIIPETGGNGEDHNPQALMLKAFVETLTDDQRTKLFESLNPGQQVALGELIQSFNH